MWNIDSRIHSGIIQIFDQGTVSPEDGYGEIPIAVAECVLDETGDGNIRMSLEGLNVPDDWFIAPSVEEINPKDNIKTDVFNVNGDVIVNNEQRNNQKQRSGLIKVVAQFNRFLHRYYSNVLSKNLKKSSERCFCFGRFNQDLFKQIKSVEDVSTMFKLSQFNVNKTISGMDSIRIRQVMILDSDMNLVPLTLKYNESNELPSLVTGLDPKLNIHGCVKKSSLSITNDQNMINHSLALTIIRDMNHIPEVDLNGCEQSTLRSLVYSKQSYR